MKKVLSFILVLSMVLGSFGMAFAAPARDEIAGHLNEDATQRLADLGIVQGDDRGFALDSNITRAEFAVLLVRALGLEGSANVSKGETQFTDVTVANGYEWATGAINVATRLGYIQGYGNGKFGPADNIRYEDAITLIVRALGYEPAAEAKGGYPVGYLVVAEQDVQNTKHVEGATGVAITRGSVFQLLDNSLTKAKMIQVGYGSETKYVVSGQEDTRKETILTTNLGFDEVEGTVVANYRVEKLKANEIKIQVEKENGVKVDRTTKYAVSDKFDFDVDAVLGLKVSAWYNDDNEEIFRYEVETDEDDVIYGEVKSNKENNKGKLVLEIKNTDNKDKKYDWAEKDSRNEIEAAVVYVENGTEDVEDVEAGSYGKFVLNEYGDVSYAYLFNFEKEGIVTSIDDEEIEFINRKDGDDDVIELEDAEEVFVFNADFTKASLEDIEAGTALFTWVDGDDNFYIVIKNVTVEGELEAVRVSSNGTDNDRITVGTTNVSVVADNAIFSDDQGDGYKVWADSITDVEDIVGEEVVVMLDLTGRVLALTTDANITSSTVYGVATYITTGRNPVLTVYTNEGKEIDYTFAERTDAKDLDGIVNTSSESFGTRFAAVSFKLNKDGEIAKDSLEATDIKYAEIDEDGDIVGNGIFAVEKDSDNKYIKHNGKTFYLRENTIFVKAYNKSDELKPSLIKYDNIINKDITDNSKAIVIGTPGKDAKLIVFVEADFKAVDDNKYGLVTDAVTVDRNGDYTTKIAVAGEGEAKYIVSERNTVKKGDLIEFNVSDKGEISIIDKNQIDVREIDDKNEFDVVADRDGNYVKFDGSEEWYLVDNDTVVWELTSKGALDKSASRVSKGDVVYKFTEGNDSNEVKVLLIANKYYADKFGEDAPGNDKDLEGTVTGTVYAIDGSTITFEVTRDTKDDEGNTVTEKVLAELEVTEDTALVSKENGVIEGIRNITVYLRSFVKKANVFEIDVLKGEKIDIIIEK